MYTRKLKRKEGKKGTKKEGRKKRREEGRKRKNQIVLSPNSIEDIKMRNMRPQEVS